MDLSTRALRFDQADYTLGEVLASAWAGGLLEDAYHTLEAGLACVQLAESEGLAIPAKRKQAAFDDWRRSRELVAADEFKKVLSAHGLAVADIVGHAERVVAKDMLAHRVDEAIAEHAPSAGVVMHLLPLEVFCTQNLERLIRDVARRFVAPVTQGETGAPDTLRAAGTKDPLLLPVFREAFLLSEADVERVLARERAFRTYRASILVERRMTATLEAMRPDLVRIEYTECVTASLDVAREAASCVQYDEESLERVATRAGLPFQKKHSVLRELDDLPLGSRLSACSVGGVVGPIAVGRDYIVAQVTARQDPDLSDAKVRSLVEENVLDRATGGELVRRAIVTFRM